MKYKDLEAKPPEHHTDEELAEIYRLDASEEIRGAVPRYREDVAVGDTPPAMAEGPAASEIRSEIGPDSILRGGRRGERIAHAAPTRRSWSPAGPVSDSWRQRPGVTPGPGRRCPDADARDLLQRRRQARRRCLLSPRPHAGRETRGARSLPWLHRRQGPLSPRQRAGAHGGRLRRPDLRLQRLGDQRRRAKPARAVQPGGGRASRADLPEYSAGGGPRAPRPVRDQLWWRDRHVGRGAR